MDRRVRAVARRAWVCPEPPHACEPGTARSPTRLSSSLLAARRRCPSRPG